MYILLALVITAIHMFTEYRRVKEDVIVELNTLYATIGQPLGIAVWDADQEQIGSLLEGLEASNLIYGVLVTGADGEIVQQAGNVVAPVKWQKIEDEFGIRLEGVGNPGNLFGYQYPISYSEAVTPNLLGHVTLFSSEFIILNKIKYQFFYIVLTECVKACILWLVFLWYGKRQLTRPLAGLAARASEITMDNLQPIHIHLPGKTRNEVSVLKDAFNTMINNLIKGVQKQKDLYSELDLLKNNLQLQVTTRTRELQERNRDLRAQIKERKEAEDKVSQYGLILENSLNEIYVYDSQSLAFLTVNEGARKNLGYSSEEIESLTVADVISDFSKEIFENMVSPLRRGEKKLLIFESTQKRKDSSTYRVEVHLQLMNFPEMEAFVAIILDISGKILLEEQLRQSHKMEAIGTLAGGIAHDFNNLLMGVQGRASLALANLEKSDPNWGHIVEIEQYVKKAENLTQQLLGIARGGKYDPKPIKLYDLAVDSLSMFGRTRKDITLTTGSDEKDLVVDVDRHQIEQVLLNIFLNAWQSMSPGGTIHLQTGLTSLDKNKIEGYTKPSAPYAMISVTDNGSGMDESTRSQIFNPFFTTKARERGTGLGLASAYGIIKNHNGFISVDSEVGHGSTFTIYLPVSDRSVQTEVSIDADPVTGGGRILLVDDEQMIIDVAGAMLTSLGYEVVTAQGGKEAIEIIRGQNGEFDLVILDLIMPDMDGSKTFDLIKQINPQQAVLLSSGYSIDGEAAEMLKRGCSGFIQKPFGMSKMSHLIEKVLKQSKQNKIPNS